MKQKRIVSLVLTAALALSLSVGLTGCGSSEKDNSASVQSVAMLMGVDLSGANQFSGVAEAQATIKVQKDANKTVEKCYVEAGDQVHVGDLLFTYDTDALELSVTSAELEVEQLKNSITNFETQITALEKDKKKAASSEQLSYTLQIQEAELSKAEAEYNLKQKEAALEQLKESASETEVRSEVAGVVQSVQKEDSDNNDYGYGYGGGSGSDAYITIMETGTYRIKGTVSEESARNLYEGMEMTAYSRLDDTQTWHGYIESINTGTTEEENNNNNGYYDGGNGEDSAKYAFYVTLDDSEGLLIGQHVYLKPGGAEEAEGEIRLPSGYLVLDGDNASVWAANASDKLELRSVTLGEYDADMDEYVIADGLTLEDYIAFPDETLKAGMSVVKYDGESFGGGEEEFVDYGEGGEEMILEGEDDVFDGEGLDNDGEFYGEEGEVPVTEEFVEDGEIIGGAEG